MNRYATCLLVVLVALAGVPAGVTAASPVGQTDAPACEYPLTLTDATGTEVMVEEVPDRVVVTGASGAQTMWELDAEEKVVGMPVQPYTAYLEGAAEKTDVTNQDGTLNVEETIATDPDLVLAANITQNEKVEQLRAAGITVYTFGLADSIPFIYQKTLTTGALTGTCEAADGVVSEMRADVQAVEDRVEGEQPPSAFVYYSGGFTATVGSFPHDVLVTAGATNVVTELNTSAYGRVSREQVIDADPDFVVVPVNNDSADPAAQLPDAYDNLTAVQEDQVVGVNADYFSQPAPRVTQPLSTLAGEFAAWQGPNEATTTTEAPETTTTDAAEATTTTESGGTPGFGPVAAVAALAAALFAGRRY